MGRTQGTFTFSNNLEVKIVQPLDARSVTGNLSDLKDGTITYPYSGMLVSVVSDITATTNNGLYMSKHTLWVEKYRPDTLKGYLGNEAFTESLGEWIEKIIFLIYYFMVHQVQVKQLLLN